MTNRHVEQGRRRVRERFAFDEPSDGSATHVLRSLLVDATDGESGIERTLRLWRKTKSGADDDLRALWRHEIRQVQRVMSYADAREVVVEAVEFVEDEDYFGIVLVRAGQPLASVLLTASPRYWMRRLSEPGARRLLWQNVHRLATALGVLHAQGLVHGNVGPEVVMTEALEEADFRLTGFEWSLWLGSEDGSTGAQGPGGSSRASPVYSFEGDWRALGHFVAWALGISLTAAGDVNVSDQRTDVPQLKKGEAQLLRRLVAPAATESVDAPSVRRAIDDLLAALARSSAAGAASLLILTFANWDRVGDSIYQVSDGAIPLDDVASQIAWIQGDLAAGATLLVPRDFDPGQSRLRLVTSNMVYELVAYHDTRTTVRTWEIAVCKNVRTRAAALPIANEEEHDLVQSVAVARRFPDAHALRASRATDIVDWSAFASVTDPDPSGRRVEVRRALLLAQTLEALVRTLENYPIEIVGWTNDGHALIRAQDQSDRDAFARTIGLGATADALVRLFDEDQRDPTVVWRLSRSSSLGAPTHRDVGARFLGRSNDGSYEFELDRDLPSGEVYFLRGERELGTEQVIRRRLRNLAGLDEQVDLGRSLEDPWRERRRSPERLGLDDQELAELDEPKRVAMRAIFDTLPSFFVVGPPGVGKTKLATEVVRRRLASEPSTRMLVSAQGHDALDHLQAELKKVLDQPALSGSLLVRSKPPEKRPGTNDDIDVVARRALEALASSELAQSAPERLRSRLEGQRTAATQAAGDDRSLTRADGAGQHALASLLVDAAQLFLSTANSQDIERLVERREQFDWVLIEEAAKATGPELVGPLLLSGRRLLIGDHHQLAPMEAERIARILRDPSQVSAALTLAKRHVAPVFGDAPELDDLVARLADPTILASTATLALRLLEPFRTFVEEDEARAKENRSHRAISSTLTQQRRMDPAIARVVSEAFYQGRLTTEAGRAASAATDSLKYQVLGAMPRSPIVVIDFPHVSTTGRGEPAESHQPRWHNRGEIESVIDVLCRIRAKPSERPSLAILSPYAAQVDRLNQRMRRLSAGPLAHLSAFASVRSNGDLVGTVDSFQGSEADLVVLSLVRNNARAGAGALGFLRDRRRMNVALSRAKNQLVVVGSLGFLDEAVRGVNPRGGAHELSFISTMVATIRAMASEQRSDGVPLVTILQPVALRRSS